MLTLQSVQQVFLAHQAFPVYGRFGNAELKLTAEQGGQILSFRRTTFPVVHRSPCLGMHATEHMGVSEARLVVRFGLSVCPPLRRRLSRSVRPGVPSARRHRIRVRR